MAKFKGIKWAQVQTMMTAIATTISQCATKTELQNVAANLSFSIEGSTLVLPSKVSIQGSTLVLPNT